MPSTRGRESHQRAHATRSGLELLPHGEASPAGRTASPLHRAVSLASGARAAGGRGAGRDGHGAAVLRGAAESPAAQSHAGSLATPASQPASEPASHRSFSSANGTPQHDARSGGTRTPDHTDASYGHSAASDDDTDDGASTATGHTAATTAAGTPMGADRAARRADQHAVESPDQRGLYGGPAQARLSPAAEARATPDTVSPETSGLALGGMGAGDVRGLTGDSPSWAAIKYDYGTSGAAVAGASGVPKKGVKEEVVVLDSSDDETTTTGSGYSGAQDSTDEDEEDDDSSSVAEGTPFLAKRPGAAVAGKNNKRTSGVSSPVRRISGGGKACWNTPEIEAQMANTRVYKDERTLRMALAGAGVVPMNVAQTVAAIGANNSSAGPALTRSGRLAARAVGQGTPSTPGSEWVRDADTVPPEVWAAVHGQSEAAGRRAPVLRSSLTRLDRWWPTLRKYAPFTPQIVFHAFSFLTFILLMCRSFHWTTHRSPSEGIVPIVLGILAYTAAMPLTYKNMVCCSGIMYVVYACLMFANLTMAVAVVCVGLVETGSQPWPYIYAVMPWTAGTMFIVFAVLILGVLSARIPDNLYNAVMGFKACFLLAPEIMIIGVLSDMKTDLWSLVPMLLFIFEAGLSLCVLIVCAMHIAKSGYHPLQRMMYWIVGTTQLLALIFLLLNRIGCPSTTLVVCILAAQFVALQAIPLHRLRRADLPNTRPKNRQQPLNARF